MTVLAGGSSLAESQSPISFNEHIRPIFVEHCVACHGGPQQAGGLSLLRRDSALAASDSGSAIVAGDADGSYLLDRVTDPDDETRMPPAEHGRRLTGSEVDRLRRWIEQGAAWQEHWSLAPLREPPIPGVGVGDRDWPRRPLDRFVLRRLLAEGLSPSPEASRAAWLRRVTFDLTGLPPCREDVAAFVADEGAGAHGRVVDRLLASPHYGERWASVWLDLARYADTKGYERDPHRDIWPYRDWLIRAFNADTPYDEFIVKQLAGDLLPGAGVEDRLATAFHRNTQTNTEGGADDEEFRVAAVVDRVNTTWQVFQATTFGCAQCHDHPYDSFSQEEYYRSLAFFNSSRDADLQEDLPTLAVPRDPADYERAGRLDREVEALRRADHAPLAALAAEAPAWRPLAFDRVRSTGSTRLRFDESTQELWAGGTVTIKSRYTLEGPAPALGGPMTALRIDALPQDVAAALRTPEMGFVLSRLRLFVENRSGEGADDGAGDGAGGRPTEVAFAYAFADEPLPEFSATDTLRDNTKGWSAYTRIGAPRHAVFLLDEPLRLAPGDRLRLVLKHERKTDGEDALVLRRARFAASADPRWTERLRDPAAVARLDRLEELLAERRGIPSTKTPVMAERGAGFGRRTHVFNRGNWLDCAEEVAPGVPASMPPLAAGGGATPTRLDLARWIASPENPLTSRTMVNRVWAELFGVGLVETLGDLGASGAAPTHPELLDHLAGRFQGSHAWRLKRLLREIVLSATYRQGARVTAELAERDPRNRLLARGPRQRLTAEMVRDQALVLSGRLAAKRFGPPVMPYQPDGVWRSAHSGAEWTMSEGDDRYRRAIYTYWKRTSGYPSLVAFDTPSREFCSARRVVTNTPLQPLVTMNDPVYVDLARAFADRMTDEAGDDPQTQIAWAYETAAGRAPGEAALRELVSLYGDAERRFAEAPGACGPLGDTAERFARVVVAMTLLNLDEVLTR